MLLPGGSFGAAGPGDDSGANAEPPAAVPREGALPKEAPGPPKPPPGAPFPDGVEAMGPAAAAA